MKHIKVEIDFRQDYNGRPKAIRSGSDLFLVVHPFYCWEQPHYGRVYSYHSLSGLDFFAIIYDYSRALEEHLDTVLASAKNKHSFTIDLKDEDREREIFTVITKKKYKIGSRRMESGDLPDGCMGFMKYQDTYWLIWSDLLYGKKMDEPKITKSQHNHRIGDFNDKDGGLIPTPVSITKKHITLENGKFLIKNWPGFKEEFEDGMVLGVPGIVHILIP